MKDEDARVRSILYSNLIRRRADDVQRRIIDDFDENLSFAPLEKLMISPRAWDHVASLDVAPKLVFAHPDILQSHPTTSLYYRGIALLSQKQVKGVGNWENGTTKRPKLPSCVRVARLYNTVISTIIEGSTDWTLKNGYRNILATMGITLDGMYRNHIGKVADALVKGRILEWLEASSLVVSAAGSNYTLPHHVTMRYGAEPDIEFNREGRVIATIEIKGGSDPAGALERLGAMRKSFSETPPGCTNFLVAGVVTPEMANRLEQIGTVKTYLLDDLARDGSTWDDFVNELFHHTVRII